MQLAISECGSMIQVQVAIMKIPYQATSSAPKGNRLVLEYTTSGAAPTSPPEGVLRRMRHQERMRAVGTQNGPIRIYGPTGYAIGGTAQLALQELIHRSHHRQASPLSVTTTGRA